MSENTIKLVIEGSFDGVGFDFTVRPIDETPATSSRSTNSVETSLLRQLIGGIEDGVTGASAVLADGSEVTYR